jgi:hypothetical protein
MELFDQSQCVLRPGLSHVLCPRQPCSEEDPYDHTDQAGHDHHEAHLPVVCPLILVILGFKHEQQTRCDIAAESGERSFVRGLNISNGVTSLASGASGYTLALYAGALGLRALRSGKCVTALIWIIDDVHNVTGSDASAP